MIEMIISSIFCAVGRRVQGGAFNQEDPQYDLWHRGTFAGRAFASILAWLSFCIVLWPQTLEAFLLTLPILPLWYLGSMIQLFESIGLGYDSPNRKLSLQKLALASLRGAVWTAPVAIYIGFLFVGLWALVTVAVASCMGLIYWAFWVLEFKFGLPDLPGFKGPTAYGEAVFGAFLGIALTLPFLIISI